MKIFETGISLKHRRVPLRIFAALWDKKFPTENSDIPFLCIKFFNTRSYLKHWMVPPRIFFGTVRRKISDGKTWNPPSLIHNFFPYQKLSETQKGPLTKIFAPVGQKIIEKAMMPPPMHQNFRYQNFFEPQKGSPTKFFGTVRQKIFDRKSWYPPLPM